MIWPHSDWVVAPLAERNSAAAGIGAADPGHRPPSLRSARGGLVRFGSVQRGEQILDDDPAVVWNPKDEGCISDGCGVIAPIVYKHAQTDTIMCQ
jgi:hypothetical protein